MIRKFIILIAVLVFLLYFSFQKFIAGIASKGMEAVLGVPVKVGRLHVRLAPFEFGVYGLKVGNPTGFKEPYLADIPELFVRVNLLDFLRGKIHVQKVVFNMKEVSVEKTQTNQINLSELMKLSKAKKTQTGTPPSGPPSDGQGAPTESPKAMKLEIDEVILNIGKISFVDYGSGQRVVREFGVEIKDMVLRDVADPFELVAQIVVIISKKIGMAVMSVQLDSVANNLETQANQLVNQARTAISNWFK